MLDIATCVARGVRIVNKPFEAEIRTPLAPVPPLLSTSEPYEGRISSIADETKTIYGLKSNSNLGTKLGLLVDFTCSHG